MKINKEGYQVITIAILVALLAIFSGAALLPGWAEWIWTAVVVGVLGLVVWFFREPSREQILEQGTVFAPADGTVVAIEEVIECEYFGDKRRMVSIFMSVTNVHINWFPVGGEVVWFEHHHGNYMVASHPKSSLQNERTTTVVDTGEGKVLFRQVAGYVARRIVSYAKVGQCVEQNTPCGFIKFGSRMDIYLPLDAEILVRIGDKTTGSQSRIAKLT